MISQRCGPLAVALTGPDRYESSPALSRIEAALPRYLPRRRPRLRTPSGAVIRSYGAQLGTVPELGRFLPTPQSVVLGFGIGRVALGTAFLVAPVASTRVLGLDSATAKRVTFLARMAAARDIGLGAGTLSAGPTRAAVPWLLAGAGADLVDATVLVGALRKGVARGLPAAAITVGAVAGAGIGFGAAVALRRE